MVSGWVGVGGAHIVIGWIGIGGTHMVIRRIVSVGGASIVV